ncbi:MAG: Sec-independent protein translocase protein TatB [Acidimicrobiales bacterium]
MFSNIGGLEVLFVMVVALIVLGPTKLPEAARQAGRFINEARRISAGFQREFREAVQDPIIEAEARVRGSIANATKAVSEPFDEMNKTFSAPVEPSEPEAASSDDPEPTDD